MKYLFIFLIYAYPLIAIFPKEYGFFSQVWGLLAILLAIVYIVDLFVVKKISRLNKFELASLVVFFSIFLSIAISNEINITKILVGIKYITPIIIGAYALKYFQNFDYRFIQKSLIVYIMIFLLLFTYRFMLIDFNLLQVTLYRGLVWYEKSHIIAQMYAALAISFFFVSSHLKNYAYVKFLIFVPIIFTSVRSVMVGTIAMLSIYSFLTIYRKYKLLSIFIYLAIISVIVIFIDPDVIKTLFLSERDAVLQSKTITANSLSSGRIIIFDFYKNNFQFIYLFFGNGMPYLEASFPMQLRLHNDFLEFFFSFGILGILSMLFAIHKNIFYSTIINSQYHHKIMLFSIWIYFTIVSLSTGIMDYQSTLYLYMIIATIYGNNQLKKVKI